MCAAAPSGTELPAHTAGKLRGHQERRSGQLEDTAGRARKTRRARADCARYGALNTAAAFSPSLQYSTGGCGSNQ